MEETMENLNKAHDGSDDQEASIGKPPCMTKMEKQNLAFLILAYACSFSVTTLEVGTSSIVVLGVGGSPSAAPVTLALFYSGSAIVSLVTCPIFCRYGRKFGFLTGVVYGLFGVGFGVLGVWIHSPMLVLVSSFPLGAANGVGMYLRFAALEVVPPHAKSLAVTLVLSGGCVAAIAGPESATLLQTLLGPTTENFLGIFGVMAVFLVMNGLFVSIVKYPSKALPLTADNAPLLLNTELNEKSNRPVNLNTVLMSHLFWVPALMAGFSWAIMAMPMSVVRLAMEQVGYSPIKSLLTLACHFLGMYSPGFFSGKLLDGLGPQTVTIIALFVWAAAMIISLLCASTDALPVWIVVLVLMGVGWHLAFASSTVLLTKAYEKAPHLKSSVQAANDFFMFLFSGFIIFSSGYIYEAGGGELNGWRTVNYVVLGLVAAMALLMAIEFHLQRTIRNSSPQHQAAETANEVELA